MYKYIRKFSLWAAMYLFNKPSIYRSRLFSDSCLRILPLLSIMQCSDGCLYVACFFVCAFFLLFFIYFSLCSSFIKLVLFRSLAWFSISLTSLNLHKCNSLLYINPRLYKHLLHLLIFNKAQCHFLVYFKVGGGQLESLCYFDHHTHFIICSVFIFIL